MKLILSMSLDCFFLILLRFKLSTRQSDTAAEKIAISQGMFVLTASSISIAVSTFMTLQFPGVSNVEGPVINVTLAPKATNAFAIALP